MAKQSKATTDDSAEFSDRRGIEQTKSNRVDAYSDCGCLRGELVGSRIEIKKVNEKCNHNLDLSNMSKGEAREVGQILMALSR